MFYIVAAENLLPAFILLNPQIVISFIICYFTTRLITLSLLLVRITVLCHCKRIIHSRRPILGNYFENRREIDRETIIPNVLKDITEVDDVIIDFRPILGNLTLPKPSLRL